jgi:hypothetical protein
MTGKSRSGPTRPGVLPYPTVAQIMRGPQHMRLGSCAAATAVVFVFGCSSGSNSGPDAVPARNTALQPNDAGIVLPIGSPCKLEDGRLGMHVRIAMPSLASRGHALRGIRSVASHVQLRQHQLSL